MTQPPRNGQPAPFEGHSGPGSGDAASARPTGFSSPYVSGTAWTPSTTVGGSAPPKLPRPDTPTGSLPPIASATPPAAFSTTAASTLPPPTTGRPAGAQTPLVGSAGGRTRGPRRAQLQLRNINPWTAFKFSSVLAVVLFFVWLIMIGVLYGILDAAGVIGHINNAYTTIKSDGSGNPITAGVVLGGAAIIGVLNMILFIALSTIGSLVYNLCADLVGGVEVTLSER